jgi:predicted DNA-binding protein (UPF0251 family)
MNNNIIVVETEHWALPGIAVKINSATDAAEASAKSAVVNALVAGRLLLEAKTHVAHGAWETWVTTNCVVAPRTARAYMRLATSLSELPEPERQRVADLPLREAVRAIATTPEAPPRREGVRAATRDDAQRAVDTFNAGAKALREASRRMGITRELKGSFVASMRKKLADALAAIDQIGIVE